MFQKSHIRLGAMLLAILTLVFGGLFASDVLAPNLALAAGADEGTGSDLFSFLSDDDDDGEEGDDDDEGEEDDDGEDDDDDDGGLANLGSAGRAVRAGFIGLPVLLVLGAAATGWIARRNKKA